MDTFFKQSQQPAKPTERPASNFSPFFDDDFTLKNNQSALQSQQLTLEQQQKSLEMVMKRLDEQQKHFDSQRQALNQQIEMLALQTQKQLTLFENTVQTKLKQPKLTSEISTKQAVKSPFGDAIPPEVANNNLQSTTPSLSMPTLPLPQGIQTFDFNFTTTQAPTSPARTVENYVPSGSLLLWSQVVPMQMLVSMVKVIQHLLCLEPSIRVFTQWQKIQN